MIRVAMQASIRKRMKQALRHAGSREVGGILMGQQLAVGHFAIVDFSLDDISGQDAHFVRDPENHRRALEHFFDQTGHDYQTFNYLGEWHSHPSFPARPSSIDIRSMQDLVEGEREIDFAVLLIVRLGFLGRLIASASLHKRGQPNEHVDLTIS